MNIKESKIVALLPPSEQNPRNSEGCFLRLDDGRIAFAYSRYTGNSFKDDAKCEIACIYSHNGGESWNTDQVETLVNAEEYGQQNVMSVTLRRMNNGDGGLFFILKQEEKESSVYYLRRYKGDFSTPLGEVQVSPRRLTGYYVINNDRVEHLSDGGWIVAAAYHRTAQFPEENGKAFDPRATVYCFRSDDDGFTWRLTAAKLDLANPYSNSGLQEPGIVELPGGTLYGFFRTDRSYQYESVSVDGGERWFAPQPSRFTSPLSPMLIKKNPFSGKYYAIWNPVPDYPGRPKTVGYVTGGRNPLVISESLDGVRFSSPCTLEDDPTRGFCYPAIEFLDEYTLLLAYCSGGKEEKGNLNRTTIRKLTLERS